MQHIVVALRMIIFTMEIHYRFTQKMAVLLSYIITEPKTSNNMIDNTNLNI